MNFIQYCKFEIIGFQGSSGEGGGGREERWWENPKLSPADLRQHSETWSLADDAAMATLLQSISQVRPGTLPTPLLCVCRYFIFLNRASDVPFLGLDL